jgi:2-polyprenyl-6-hydroxyphenyl methylase/3-demethylubiquinone-9 3-methyltransferase
VAATPVQGDADVRSFFDGCAAAYAEQHGHPERLLAGRLALIRAHAGLRPQDAVLDVGCGPGQHLLALAPEIAGGVGVDLSPRMIEVARAALASSPSRQRLRFEVADAQALGPPAVPPGSFDLALCIGALEHMLDKRAALAGIHRALAPGGRLFCLGPSGDYLWYRRIAPLLGFATKHLSSDVFLGRAELTALLSEAGFERVRTGPWTFIPRGDMPPVLASLLGGLDAVGRVAGWRALRGGLWACAWKD